jgi:quercetin dioxygenase-like cupin family protein
VIVVRGSSGFGSERRGATFTGEVWADPVVAPEGATVATVFFTPGARTYWHHHERGQILQVLAGRGWVCSEGDEPVLLGAGDTVWVPPGERHWHGASAESFLTHTAISLGTTSWLAEVDQSVYDAAHASLRAAKRSDQ